MVLPSNLTTHSVRRSRAQVAEEEVLNERVAKIAAEAEVQALAIQLRERVDELDVINEVLNQPVGGWAH